MFTDAQEDEDYADSRILDGYRQQRMNQLKEAAFRNRFGEVFDIVKADWIKEVTEASNNCIVIVHLYENSIVECEVLDEAMRVLAPKFKYLKFLRIKSTHAIENWPERNLPALFIYEDGAMKTQLVTLKSLDGKSTKAEGNSSTPVIIITATTEEMSQLTSSSAQTSRRPGVVSVGEGHREGLGAGRGPQVAPHQREEGHELRHQLPRLQQPRLGR